MALRAHDAAKHPWRCIICGKSFASQEALHSHQMAKHAPQSVRAMIHADPSTSFRLYLLLILFSLLSMGALLSYYYYRLVVLSRTIQTS